MKKYLIYFFAMLMTASSLVLTSCSSDDDEIGDNNYAEMIVGSWKNKIAIDEDWYGEWYIRFYSDGTYKDVDITVYSDYKDVEHSSGSWSISGNKITTHVNDGISGLDTGTSTITKMTATEMVISAAGIDLTYTKVADSVFESYYNQE